VCRASPQLVFGFSDCDCDSDSCQRATLASIATTAPLSLSAYRTPLSFWPLGVAAPLSSSPARTHFHSHCDSHCHSRSQRPPLSLTDRQSSSPPLRAVSFLLCSPVSFTQRFIDTARLTVDKTQTGQTAHNVCSRTE